MPDFDDALVKEALDALSVQDLEELKGGGQKAVRLVEQDGQRLILKIISFDVSSAETLRRAEREVSLLRSLASPHVVRVVSELVELGQPVRGAAWLEEALDGQDLGTLLFSRHWNWDETAIMGLHVAQGLAAAHERSVVHRDLSANNVRRLANGAYKVMDFGFARYTLRSGLTVAGQPGTRGYMSPEHLHAYSGAPTPASDIFSLGILMFAALTGELPIPYRGDDNDYATRLHAARVPDLAALRTDISPERVAVVQRCLHPQPARRFINGKRLVEALKSQE